MVLASPPCTLPPVPGSYGLATTFLTAPSTSISLIIPMDRLVVPVLAEFLSVFHFVFLCCEQFKMVQINACLGFAGVMKYHAIGYCSVMVFPDPAVSWKCMRHTWANVQGKYAIVACATNSSGPYQAS